MATNTIANEIGKYFTGLAATNLVCTEFGTTFTNGKNMFIGIEPVSATQCISIIPYGGAPPSIEGNRQEAAVQIRVKTLKKSTGLRTSQAVINTLHANTSVCASQPGKVYAVQSSPIFLDQYEGGKYVITVSNYYIKHIKL
jgi:hypothetical protein